MSSKRRVVSQTTTRSQSGITKDGGRSLHTAHAARRTSKARQNQYRVERPTCSDCRRRGTNCEHTVPTPDEKRHEALYLKDNAQLHGDDRLRGCIPGDVVHATGEMHTQLPQPGLAHPPVLMQQPFWSENATVNHWIPAQSTMDMTLISGRPFGMENTILDNATAYGEVVSGAMTNPLDSFPSSQLLQEGCGFYVPSTINNNLQGHYDMSSLDRSVLIDPLMTTAQHPLLPADHSALSKFDGIDAFSPWIRRIFDRQGFLMKASVWLERDSDTQNDTRAPSHYSPHQAFGNLAFSSAIDSNHYPADIQEMQRHSLFTPPWGAMPLSDSEALDDPMAAIFRECRAAIDNGASADEVCGTHAYIGALDDPAVYDKAPKLSQMMARLVTSVKPNRDYTTFTMYALMSTHWALFRWMLQPSPQNYAEIPEIVRPSPWQMFRRHWLVVDFVHSPEMRKHFCSNQYLDLQWMANACSTIACDWERPVIEALCYDGWTGALDLNPIARSQAGRFSSWSLGPSIWHYLPDANRFWRIRDRDE